MAILSAVRSYRNVLMALLVVGSLATACKNSGGSDPDVDPRDQYVGTYEGGVSSTLKVGTFEGTTQTGSATIVITKAPNPREIYVEANASLGRPTPFKVTAELSDAGFTVIDRNRDQMNVLGKTVEGEFRATGVLSDNQIAIAAATEAISTGTAVRRDEAFTGTRK